LQAIICRFDVRFYVSFLSAYMGGEICTANMHIQSAHPVCTSNLHIQSAHLICIQCNRLHILLHIQSPHRKRKCNRPPLPLKLLGAAIDTSALAACVYWRQIMNTCHWRLVKNMHLKWRLLKRRRTFPSVRPSICPLVGLLADACDGRRDRYPSIH
jgi:hypothetical protein